LPSAIHIGKSELSIPYSVSSSGTDSSVSHSKASQRDENTNEASLKLVESLMSHDKVELFHRRFEEGHDVQEDDMYVRIMV